MMHFVMLLLSVGMVGCGAKGGSESGNGTGGVFVPPTLDGIRIEGGTTVEIGEALVLTALGEYSDDSEVPVTATWTVSDDAIAALSHAVSSTSVLAGKEEGTVDVEITLGAFQAQLTVTVAWTLPDSVGDFYSITAYGEIQRHAGDGTPAITIATVPGALDCGFCMTPERDGFYVETRQWLDEAGTTYALSVQKCDLATGALSFVATLPNGGSGAVASSSVYFGFDYDDQGRLYAAWNYNELHRIDPATGAVEYLGRIGGGWNISTAVGPDDNVYTTPLLTSPGGAWLTKFDMATGTSRMWATTYGAYGVGGMVIISGNAMDRRGRAYAACFSEPTVYGFQDLNGDGDALDVTEAGDLWEEKTFGTMPFAIEEGFVEAPAVTHGGGLLISAHAAGQPWEGIWWLTDRDGSGTCDASEVTMVSPTAMANARGGSPIQARR